LQYTIKMAGTYLVPAIRFHIRRLTSLKQRHLSQYEHRQRSNQADRKQEHQRDHESLLCAHT
ncbi:MAG TPA: hypothetical protein VN843_22895, partial [Anaerolineales bacterium]|nr:hypothetical protein [Anaerolineales bacterium]